MKWLLCLVCVLGCSVDEREKPVAPDMYPLVAAYANPSRSFDEATAIELQSLLESKVRALFDLHALADRIENTLAAIGEEDDAVARTSRSRVPVEFYGEGYARIERICEGHGDPTPPVDKDENGYLELTVGYTRDGIDPVIFGGAVACAEQIETRRLQLAGNVNLFVGNALSLRSVPATPVLFQLADFSFSVNDTELVTGGFDFMVCRGTTSHCKSGSVEMLLDLPTGGTIAFFFDSATRAGGFRGANGIWTCAFADGQCQDEQGNLVTTPVYQL